MKKIIFLACALGAVALGAISCSEGEEEQFAVFSDFNYRVVMENGDEVVSPDWAPILPGCYPDPSIVRVDDDYSLVNSSFVPTIRVFRYGTAPICATGRGWAMCSTAANSLRSPTASVCRGGIVCTRHFPQSRQWDILYDYDPCRQRGDILRHHHRPKERRVERPGVASGGGRYRPVDTFRHRREGIHQSTMTLPTASLSTAATAPSASVISTGRQARREVRRR